MSFIHILCALLVVVVWGLNFSVCKVGLAHVPPFLFSGLRFIFTAFPLLLFIPRPKTVSWPLLSAISLSYNLVAFGLCVYGINLGVPVGLVSLLFQSQVFFSVIFSKLFLKVTPSLNQIVGLLIATVGMVAVAHTVSGSEIPLSGALCVILGGGFWGLGNVLSKKAGPVDSLALIVWSGVIAGIANLSISLFVEGPHVFVSFISNISIESLGSLGYVIIFATLIGASVQTHLFKIYSPTSVTPFSLLIPIVGMITGYIWFQEEITLPTQLSCCIVFLGLIVNQLPSHYIFSRTRRGQGYQDSRNDAPIKKVA